MWVIGLLLGALIFFGGRETVNTPVRANSTRVEIHEVKINSLKEGLGEIKLELKEQRVMIEDIHRILIHE